MKYKIITKLNFSWLAWLVILIITSTFAFLIDNNASKIIFGTITPIICSYQITFLLSNKYTIYKWWFNFGFRGKTHREELLRYICKDDLEDKGGDIFWDKIVVLRDKFNKDVSPSIQIYELFVNYFGFNLSICEKFENFVKHFKREEIVYYLNNNCKLIPDDSRGCRFSGINYRLFEEESGLNLNVVETTIYVIEGNKQIEKSVYYVE